MVKQHQLDPLVRRAVLQRARQFFQRRVADNTRIEADDGARRLEADIHPAEVMQHGVQHGGLAAGSVGMAFFSPAVGQPEPVADVVPVVIPHVQLPLDRFQHKNCRMLI